MVSGDVLVKVVNRNFERLRPAVIRRVAPSLSAARDPKLEQLLVPTKSLDEEVVLDLYWNLRMRLKD